MITYTLNLEFATFDWILAYWRSLKGVRFENRMYTTKSICITINLNQFDCSDGVNVRLIYSYIWDVKHKLCKFFLSKPSKDVQDVGFINYNAKLCVPLTPTSFGARFYFLE